jgi:hypothetical protein
VIRFGRVAVGLKTRSSAAHHQPCEHAHPEPFQCHGERRRRLGSNRRCRKRAGCNRGLGAGRGTGADDTGHDAIEALLRWVVEVARVEQQPSHAIGVLVAESLELVHGLVPWRDICARSRLTRAS